jgi:glycine betaine catabolism A
MVPTSQRDAGCQIGEAVSNLSATTAGLVDIESLVERRAQGYTLETPFYTSQEVFDLDIKAIFAKHWLFAAAEAEFPEPGDFVTIDLGPYSVVLVRDDDENVRAFRNVCRHRGSRLVSEPSGSVGNLVCPYHQWTYRTDGSLVFAEAQAPGFDRGRFGLIRVKVRTLAGLVYICLAEDAPADFDEVSQAVEPLLAPYELASAKVAHQMDLPIEGNWKVLHCHGAHPELVTAYFPLFGYSPEDVTPRMRPIFERYQAAAADLRSACARMRIPTLTRRELDTRITGYQVQRLPLDGAGSSFGTDGKPVCSKLMGSISEPRFGDLSFHTQPNSWFHVLSDHAIVFRVLPVSAGKSILRTTWLVHPDAVEGVDYDVDTLTAVWRATSDQDAVLVAATQLGVSDPSYIPGPYSEVEGDVEAFVRWYIGRVREHIGR